MESEQDYFALSRLGEALTGLNGKLEAKDVQPLAAALVKRMESEQDYSAVSALGTALAGLSGKLEGERRAATCRGAGQADGERAAQLCPFDAG
jgi:hypothetical protein